MNNSILFLLFALTLCFADIKAQTLVGLNIGTGLPFGDFADTDADNDDAGFAKAGLHINASLDHPFSENIGIASSILYGSNTLDENVLDDFFGFGTQHNKTPRFG